MDLGLRGKAALVAGGSAGIGFEIARDLIREGATVATCGVTGTVRVVDGGRAMGV